MFVNYNDYELLYLISEGSERALKVLFNKYRYFINKTVKKIYPYGDKRDDLIQEGYMMLYESIRKYNPCLMVPFFAYFELILKRRYNYLIEHCTYYDRKLVFMDKEIDCYTPSYGGKNKYILKSTLLWDEEFDIIFYQEHFIEGFSLKALAEKYYVTYHYLYHKRLRMLAALKKMLTNS